MMEFLCENYPHLADNVFRKVPSPTYPWISRLADSSPKIKEYLTVGRSCVFVEELTITNRLNGAMEVETVPDIGNPLEGQAKQIFTDSLSIYSSVDADENFMAFLRNLRIPIFCCKLVLCVYQENSALECIQMFEHVKLLVDIANKYNQDFLLNPVFKNEKMITLQARSNRINFRESTLRRILYGTSLYGQADKVIEFLQRFIEGKQTVRHFEFYGKISKRFRDTVISTFPENVTEESKGFLRLKTEEEEAFLLCENYHFLFRSVKKANLHILAPYFNMEYVDRKFELPKFDNDEKMPIYIEDEDLVVEQPMEHQSIVRFVLYKQKSAPRLIRARADIAAVTIALPKMMEFLCENYPHLADNVLRKVPSPTYPWISRLADSSPKIKEYLTVGRHCVFLEELSITHIGNGAMHVKTLPDIGNPLEGNDGQTRQIFADSLLIYSKISGHAEENYMTTLRNLRSPIFCCELVLLVYQENSALECIQMFDHVKLLLETNSEFSPDFLLNPVLKNEKMISLENCEDLIKFRETNLRRLYYGTNSFGEDDEIMEFLKRFMVGKQTVRHFEYSGEVSKLFRRRVISTFAGNITEESQGFLRLKTAEEEAFLLCEDHHFLFRSVKKANLHILLPYFNMEYVDGKLDLPEFDNDDQMPIYVEDEDLEVEEPMKH